MAACDVAQTRVPVHTAVSGAAPEASAGESQEAGARSVGGDASVALDAGGTSSPEEAGAALAPSLRFPDPLAELPRGAEQRARLCARGLDDVVVDLFCGREEPRIESLAALLAALGFDPTEPTGLRGFTLSGHTAALSKRSVSAINPRVIFTQLEVDDLPLLALAFARGETFVELVARNRASAELEFYVLAF